MKLSAATLCLCLALALPALGASQLEALRSGARSAREQTSALRSEQLAKRNQLSQLSTRIEGLKAQAQGKLLSGSELDAALKQSQELSTNLTELAQRLSSRETEQEAANLALVEALSAEWTHLRSDFDRQSDRSARRALVEQMKRVRAERDSVRAMLPATTVPALDVLRPSDDPEELLEQADLLRDNEEKARRELQSVERRITERKDEADLDKRVQRFLGEESMFDDQDRRLRLQKTTNVTLSAQGTPQPPPAGGAAGEANRSGDPTSRDGVTAGAFTGGPPGSGTSPTAMGAADNSKGTSTGGSDSFRGLDNSNVTVSKATDARPQVGANRPIATGDDDDLDDLEVQRVKLKSLVDELHHKAAELDKRAGQLK